MTAYVYNELTYGLSSSPSSRSECRDPLYKYEAHFPDRLARMILPDTPSTTKNNTRRRGRMRQATRHKTQPITFDEIKEVDEEVPPGSATNDVKVELRNQFEAFSKSMDGLLSPGHASLSNVQPKLTSGDNVAEDTMMSLELAHELSRARRCRSQKQSRDKTIDEIPELDKFDKRDV